jgi:hypothetical protein
MCQFESGSHPDDAVHIAPISSQIPCKQGILQGKPRFQPSRWSFKNMKPLRHGDFLYNSLSKLFSEDQGILSANKGVRRFSLKNRHSRIEACRLLRTDGMLL